MSGKALRQRNGSLYLVVLFAIFAGGVGALQLLPDHSIQDKRGKALQLRMTIGQLRQAFDMKYLVDPNYDPDLSTSIQIKAELKKLADENYLREESLSDLTIQKHLWNTQDCYFWYGISNFSQNSSFENLQADGSASSWTLIKDTQAQSDNIYLDTPQIDTYTAQNKLGKDFSTVGKSLKITYP